MSKKKNLKQEVLISETEETTDAVVVTNESVVAPAKEEKVSKNSKQENKSKDDNKNKKDKKPKEKGRLKRKARETVSELKKVTWPSFGEVCKKTGIVLAVVVLFGLVLFGLDALLGYLFGLLT